VWDVVFEIDKAQKPDLDRAEGLGQDYDEREIEVACARGMFKAVMYFATDKDPSLRPYDWYKELVVAGSLEHGLPGPYVEMLEGVTSIADPDGTRASANKKFLSLQTYRLCTTAA